MINYSDGSEHSVLELLKKEKEPGSNYDIAADLHSNWTIRYHLSKLRSNCLRHLDFSSFDVLELGAGTGAISRYLAENSKSLTVVEGSSERYECLKERLRDLNNWNGFLCNYIEFSSDKKYDTVCLIGVLEYAGVYIRTPEPFLKALQHARSLLKEDGVLLIAIENKNGLKYYTGATEDHFGKYFYGICGYPEDSNDIKTFSQKEMKDLLANAGYAECEVHHLFPDYKMTRAVLSDEFLLNKPEVCADIQTSFSFEDYSGKKALLFPEKLAAASLAKSGILHEFSNSYLFIAANSTNSAIKNKLLSKFNNASKLGILYSYKRKNEITTNFVKQNSKIYVKKEYMYPKNIKNNSTIKQNLYISPLLEGKNLYTLLTNYAYYQKYDMFMNLLTEYIEYAFLKYRKDDNTLTPESVDAITRNALITSSGSFENFDLEYTTDFDINKSYFIFRNVSDLSEIISYFESLPFRTFADFYEYLCKKFQLKNNLKKDLQQEINFQNNVSGQKIDEKSFYESLHRQISTRIFALDRKYPVVTKFGFFKITKTETKIIIKVAGIKITIKKI